MESIPLRKIRAKAEDYFDRLDANDARFQYTATVAHEDGSFSCYQHAFLMTAEDKQSNMTSSPSDCWVIVFSESQGVIIHHNTELIDYWQANRSSLHIQELIP